MPPGWTAQTEGYYLNTEALSNLAAAAKTYRLERDAWEAAYRELTSNTEQFETRMKSQLATIEQEIEAERRAWQKRLRAASAPGFGFFGGVGYTLDGEIEPVVGAGLVWRLW